MLPLCNTSPWARIVPFTLTARRELWIPLIQGVHPPPLLHRHKPGPARSSSTPASKGSANSKATHPGGATRMRTTGNPRCPFSCRLCSFLLGLPHSPVQWYLSGRIDLRFVFVYITSKENLMQSISYTHLWYPIRTRFGVRLLFASFGVWRPQSLDL